MIGSLMSVLKVCGYVLLSARVTRVIVPLWFFRLLRWSTSAPRGRGFRFPRLLVGVDVEHDVLATVNAAHDACIIVPPPAFFFVCAPPALSSRARRFMSKRFRRREKSFEGLRVRGLFWIPFFLLKKSAKKKIKQKEKASCKILRYQRRVSFSFCLHAYTSMRC